MADATPTIYDWAGGRDAFARWLNRFYDLVELDAPEIAAMFGGKVSRQHRDHVTDWWAEVMGGPAVYDVGLPADPEFRAAIMGYAEWGTRLAQHNSQPGVQAPAHAPVPHWGWGVAPPYEPPVQNAPPPAT
jgi:hemoglobin